MKIIANFYTIEDETPIFSMYDLSSIPFTVGDEINLDVDELYPIDYTKFRVDVQKNMIENADEHRKMFNRKMIKIVSKRHYARFNNLKTGTMTIEYHCELLL